MLTRRLLHHECNRRLRLGDFEDATRGFIALVRSAPHDFDARLRLADALLSAGQPELALPVYVFVLRETANAGHPLKAMVVLEILEALGHPEVPMLIEAMAARYAAGAPSLGRGVRLAPPDPEGEVPQAAFVPADLTPSQVLLAGAQVGASRDGLPALPEKLTPIALLSELPHDAFVSLLGAVQLKRVPMGDVIVREGDAGDAFFMVARGAVRVTRGPDASAFTLATLGEGSVFGEMALLSDAPRTATIRASEDADVIVFAREAIAAVSQSIELVGAALERFARDRLLSNLLATHPIFRPFDRAQKQQLAAKFSAVTAQPGAVIVREGDPGRGLYIVLHGTVQVTKHDEGNDVPLATLGSGEVFGEIALLETGLATATVTAVKSTTVMFLARDVFDRLLEGVPEIRAFFEQLAEERTMDTNLTLAAAREQGGEEEEIDVALDELVLV